MDEQPEGRKFVLRAPGTEVENDGPSPQPVASDPGPPASPPVIASTPEGGYLPPVTLEHMRPPPEKPTDPSAEPLERRIGLVLLGVGGSAACLLPTLPWYRATLQILSSADTLDALPPTAGIRNWAGLACLMGGIAATVCLIAILTPRTARHRPTLGLVAACIGAGVTLCAIIGSTLRPAVIDAGGLLIRTTPWVMLTAVAGISIVVGGILARR